jgi:two-component system repressor protein LuxO
LREREEDVVEIAYSLLGYMSLEEEKSFTRFAPDVIERFIAYEWPGNVRQLQNVIRNAVVLNYGKEVTLDMLPPPINKVSTKIALGNNEQQINGSDELLEGQLTRVPLPEEILPLWQVEKRIIEEAIEAFDGNIPKAANALEVSPSTIYRKKQAWS